MAVYAAYNNVWEEWEGEKSFESDEEALKWFGENFDVEDCDLLKVIKKEQN